MICWEETPSGTWKWEQELRKWGQPSGGLSDSCLLPKDQLCAPLTQSFVFLQCLLPFHSLSPKCINFAFSLPKKTSLVSSVTHVLEIYLESTGNELGDPGLPKQGSAPRALLQAVATSASCQSSGPTDGFPRHTCA